MGDYFLYEGRVTWREWRAAKFHGKNEWNAPSLIEF